MHQNPQRGAKLIALATSLLVLAGAAPATDTQVDELLAKAASAREAGDLPGAIELLRAAHGLDPMPEFLNNIGRMLETLGRYQEAFETYKRVSDDPEADKALRALDAARAAELRPLIHRAWLRPTLTPDNSELRVDGLVPTPEYGGEIGLSPGPHTLELFEPSTGYIRLKTRAYPVGQRTVLKVNLSRQSTKDGRIVWDEEDAPKAFLVGEYAVSSDLTGSRTLGLSPGTHALQVALEDGTVLETSVVMVRGDVRSLKGILASATPKAPPAAATVAVAQTAPVPTSSEPAIEPATSETGSADTKASDDAQRPTTAAEGPEATPAVDSAPDQAGSGEVRVVANVEGARGRIGDGDFEVLTHTWTGVSAGTHFVSVEADGYAPWSEQVLVRAGRRTEVVAELTTAGRLRVSADGEKPSEVFLEGKLVGKTPLYLDVQTGTYTLLVKSQTGQQQEITVAVGKQGTTAAHADFGKARRRVRHRAMALSAQPIDKGYGTLDLGLGWPTLAMVRINTGLNDQLDIGLTWLNSAHVLNEFLVRAKWLIVRSRAFAVAAEGRLGFGLGTEERRSFRGDVTLLASILIREKAAVTARASAGFASDWQTEQASTTSFLLPVGLSVEVRLNKWWNLALLVEGEPATRSRSVYEPLHDPLEVLDMDRPHIRGTGGFSLLF